MILIPGTRVVIDASSLDTIPLKAQIDGRTATILRHATPEISRRQVWTDETYAIRIEGETGERMLSRDSLVVLRDPDVPAIVERSVRLALDPTLPVDGSEPLDEQRRRFV